VAAFYAIALRRSVRAGGGDLLDWVAAVMRIFTQLQVDVDLQLIDGRCPMSAGSAGALAKRIHAGE
jgi:hypothetical protein